MDFDVAKLASKSDDIVVFILVLLLEVFAFEFEGVDLEGEFVDLLVFVDGVILVLGGHWTEFDGVVLEFGQALVFSVYLWLEIWDVLDFGFYVRLQFGYYDLFLLDLLGYVLEILLFHLALGA